MSRTTASAVEAVLMSDWDGTTDVSFAIEIASSFVDDVVTCAANKGLTLTTAKLEILERKLAAHFYMRSDQGLTAKSTGSTSGTFEFKPGMLLEGTRHGQDAMMLDPTGCVNALGKRLSAGAFWTGKAPSEQIDYQDRS